jgi:hypothetical protein
MQCRREQFSNKVTRRLELEVLERDLTAAAGSKTKHND